MQCRTGVYARRALCVLCALCVLFVGPARADVTDYIGKTVAAVHLIVEGRETTDPSIAQVVENVAWDFIEADADNGVFFIPSVREGHAMFDLAGFIRMRLEAAGILMIDDLGLDTYADERFFSYRRSVHRKEPDYGRHIHAIALEG